MIVIQTLSLTLQKKLTLLCHHWESKCITSKLSSNWEDHLHFSKIFHLLCTPRLFIQRTCFAFMQLSHSSALKSQPDMMTEKEKSEISLVLLKHRRGPTLSSSVQNTAETKKTSETPNGIMTVTWEPLCNQPGHTAVGLSMHGQSTSNWPTYLVCKILVWRSVVAHLNLTRCMSPFWQNTRTDAIATLSCKRKLNTSQVELELQGTTWTM